MTINTERDIRGPAKLARPAPLAQKRRAAAGEVEQRFARDGDKPVARGRASLIRAWRAAETDASQTPWPEARTPTTAARQPFARDAQPGALERAARMRAIEQAWKEERARQAELEAEEQHSAEAAIARRAAEARGQPAS